MAKFKVTALDVWGHHPSECETFDTSTEHGQQECWDQCGGWDVNNWFDAGVVDVPTVADNAALLRLFIDGGWLKDGVTLEQVRFDEQSSEGFFQVEDAETGEPLYQCYQLQDSESEHSDD
jgi:hypothetical protein